MRLTTDKHYCTKLWTANEFPGSPYIKIGNAIKHINHILEGVVGLAPGNL